MTTRTQLLERIDAFLAKHGLSERQFGLDAVRDHRLIARLRAGKGTLRNIERAEAFMDARDRGSSAGEAA